MSRDLAEERPFNVAYFTVAIVLLGIETLIALFVRDGFVRPYLGDVLAVALVYATLRAVKPLSVAPALLLTLAIALTIEIAQAFDVLRMLGLADNQLARIVLGGVFDWRDLAAYAVGGLIIAALELALKYKSGERG